MRAILSAFLVLATLAGAPAYAQAPMPARPAMMMEGALLTVVAEGRTKIAPDIATINVGVVTEAPTADAAVAKNTAQMNKVMAALKRVGIADKDIQTSSLSVNPQYQYGENQPPKLNGYQANNNVTVKVRNLKNVGKAVDSVVTDGSNQVSGISFGLDDDTKAMDLARTDAVKKARARAEIYAAAAGLKVDRILSISEAGASPPVAYPMPIAMARASKAEGAPPVSGGELDISIDVTVTFTLK
ncbi:MAG TPA: SIMPL domain-containing protein [Caulobacterales bacterium]|nr:SIMPL domain-containing protein [Caulobacterales bacterium]